MLLTLCCFVVMKHSLDTLIAAVIIIIIIIIIVVSSEYESY